MKKKMLKRVNNISTGTGLNEPFKHDLRVVQKVKSRPNYKEEDSFTSSATFNVLSKTGLDVKKIESDGKIFTIFFEADKIQFTVSAEHDNIANLKFINYLIRYMGYSSEFKIKFNSNKFGITINSPFLRALKKFFLHVADSGITNFKSNITGSKDLDNLTNGLNEDLNLEFTLLNNMFVTVMSKYLNLNLTRESFRNNDAQDLMILLEVKIINA